MVLKSLYLRLVSPVKWLCTVEDRTVSIENKKYLFLISYCTFYSYPGKLVSCVVRNNAF